MARYRTFTEPLQIKKAISKAKKSGDKIALSKLRRFKDYKFKKIKKVQIYY